MIAQVLNERLTDMKTFKNISVVILIVTIILATSGCSKQDVVTKKDYSDAKQNITLDCGVTVIELKSMMRDFITEVYAPKSEKSITDGIDTFKSYMTADEYNKLVSDAGEYKDDIKTSVSDIEIYYGTADNMSDHMNRLYATFNVKNNSYEQCKAIEFVFNQNNKIFKHYLWTSGILNT